MTSKQFVLLGCVFLVIPLIFLIIGSMLHVSANKDFEDSVLGKLVS